MSDFVNEKNEKVRGTCNVEEDNGETDQPRYGGLLVDDLSGVCDM